MGKKWKKVLGVLWLGVTALTITACGSRKEYEQLACSLLEEKYGESFEIENYLGHEWTEDFFEVLVSPTEHPDIFFEAQVKCDGSGLSDEYIEARVCRKVEEQIAENISTLKGYFIVKSHAVIKSIRSNDSDMSISEFVEQIPENSFAVYLHYCPEQDSAQNVYQALSKTFNHLEMLKGNIQFYITDEKTLKSVQGYFEENSKIYSEYKKILENSHHIIIPFENGTIQMTEDDFLMQWVRIYELHG